MPLTCEDCGTKVPSFGHLADGKKRWCGTCAQSHEGVVSLQQQKKCEDCGTKQRWFAKWKNWLLLATPSSSDRTTGDDSDARGGVRGDESA